MIQFAVFHCHELETFWLAYFHWMVHPLAIISMTHCQSIVSPQWLIVPLLCVYLPTSIWWCHVIYYKLYHIMKIVTYCNNNDWSSDICINYISGMVIPKLYIIYTHMPMQGSAHKINWVSITQLFLCDTRHKFKTWCFCIGLLPNFAINMNNNPKLIQHQTTQYYHCSFILDMKNNYQHNLRHTSALMMM